MSAESRWKSASTISTGFILASRMQVDGSVLTLQDFATLVAIEQHGKIDRHPLEELFDPLAAIGNG